MRFYEKAIRVGTKARIALTNITDAVSGVVKKSRIKTGICVINVSHTTCAVVVNEAEEGLIADIERLAADMLAPLAREGGFIHDKIDSNAQAHLTSIVLGGNVTLPVRSAALRLGSWQSVFLVECDGPRTRTVEVSLIGE